MKQFNQFKTKSFFTLAVLIAFAFGSCTMVKSTDVNNFNRVKYNTHVKLNKKSQQEKLEVNKMESINNADLAIIETENKHEILVAENKTEVKEVQPKKIKRNKAIQNYSSAINSTKKASNSSAKAVESTNFMLNKLQDLVPFATANLEPAPVSSDSALGNLIWLILVVLLVLILLSILGGLGGSVIGTLIGILVILLILRLLGII